MNNIPETEVSKVCLRSTRDLQRRNSDRVVIFGMAYRTVIMQIFEHQCMAFSDALAIVSPSNRTWAPVAK